MAKARLLEAQAFENLSLSRVRGFSNVFIMLL